MQVQAKLRIIRGSAQKARLVADQIRGMSVERALEILQFSGKKAATPIRKVLESAMWTRWSLKAYRSMTVRR